MYEAYWRLTEKPFENTPDPRFFFATPQHEESLSRLLYCVRESKGCGVLTGTFGCGKTLVGRTLMRELGAEIYRSVFLVHPQLDALELLSAIVTGLGAAGPPHEAR